MQDNNVYVQDIYAHIYGNQAYMQKYVYMQYYYAHMQYIHVYMQDIYAYGKMIMYTHITFVTRGIFYAIGNIYVVMSLQGHRKYVPTQNKNKTKTNKKTPVQLKTFLWTLLHLKHHTWIK